MIPTLPTVAFEVAFDDGPLVVSPSWTDVTADVLEARTARSLGDDLSPAPTGTMAIRLKNRDRKYDPTHESGAYYGKLLPRRQIRLRATWNAVTYDVFRGWVQGWPQEYPLDGTHAEVSVSCVDALGVLGGMSLPLDVMPEIIADIATPHLWWRMGDSGTRLWDSGGGLRHATASMTPLNSSSLADGLIGRSTKFTGQLTATLARTTPGGGGTVPGVTISAWARTTTPGDSTTALNTLWSQVGIGGVNPTIGIDDGGLVRSRWVEDDGVGFNAIEAVSTARVDDGLAHHIVVTLSNDAELLSVYVDGVLSGTDAFSSTSSFVEGGTIIIGPAAGSTDLEYVGELQDVVYWQETLSATDIEDLYNAGTGRVEETAADRAIRLLDAIGWPSGLRDISTDADTQCGSLSYNKGNALNALQVVESTEQGIMFAAKDGKVTLLPRYYGYESTEGGTSQATFSDAGADVRYAGLALAYDADMTVNDITVNIEGASPQNAEASTAIDDLGRRSTSVNTVLAETGDAYQMAHGLVAVHSSPVVRPEAFDVFPARNPSVWWPIVLSLELGYRVTIERTPLGVGSPISLQAMLTHVEHQFTPGSWVCRFRASPRSTTGFFQIGVSEIGGPDVIGF